MVSPHDLIYSYHAALSVVAELAKTTKRLFEKYRKSTGKKVRKSYWHMVPKNRFQRTKGMISSVMVFVRLQLFQKMKEYLWTNSGCEIDEIGTKWGLAFTSRIKKSYRTQFYYTTITESCSSTWLQSQRLHWKKNEMTKSFTIAKKDGTWIWINTTSLSVQISTSMIPPSTKDNDDWGFVWL